jgi:glycerophosphoryl diester phosphodiesterase
MLQMFPSIIAHRGASFDAPENTLAAYRLAWQQKADGAEGDFRLTRDGQIVCMHDRTTRRTADRELIVEEATLDELKQLDAGRWKDSSFANQRIPTLEEILAELPADKLFFIEIKCGTEIFPAIKTTIARSKISAEQLRILSFNKEVLAAAQNVFPEIKRHWLVEYETDAEAGSIVPTPQSILNTLGEVGANGPNSAANHHVLTPAFIAELRRREFEVAAWTVDDPAVARRLMKAGVQMLTTNRPGSMRREFAAVPPSPTIG